MRALGRARGDKQTRPKTRPDFSKSARQLRSVVRRRAVARANADAIRQLYWSNLIQIIAYQSKYLLCVFGASWSAGGCERGGGDETDDTDGDPGEEPSSPNHPPTSHASHKLVHPSESSTSTRTTLKVRKRLIRPSSGLSASFRPYCCHRDFEGHLLRPCRRLRKGDLSRKNAPH